MSPKIHAEFWTDPELDNIGPELRLTLLWMISNPMTDFTGLFQLTPRRFVFETGLEAQWLEEALQTLPKMFVIEGQFVWLRTFIKHQYGTGEQLRKNNIAKSVRNQVRRMPQTIIQEAIWTEYPELLNLPEGVGKGLVSPSKPFQALPSSMDSGVSTQSHTPSDTKPFGGLPKPSEGQINRNINSIRNREEGKGTGEGDHYPEVEQGPGGFKPRYDLAGEALDFLNKKTGANFLKNTAVLHEMALRLHEVNFDLAGVQKMIERQVAMWRWDAKMQTWLRPQTLFESVKFHNYYGQRDMALDTQGLEEQRAALVERIDSSRANAQSVYHSPEATDIEKAELKKWRAELGEVQKQLASGK